MYKQHNIILDVRDYCVPVFDMINIIVFGEVVKTIV